MDEIIDIEGLFLPHLLLIVIEALKAWIARVAA